MTLGVTVALIGVGGALLGSLIGGLTSFVALRTQLKHEAEQAERSRQLTLRREVYLEAVAALARAQFQLSTLGRPESSLDAIVEEIKNYPEVLAKAQVVASESTFLAFDAFGEFMISSVAELLPRRFRLDEVQREIEAENRSAALLNQRCLIVQQILQSITPENPAYEQGKSELAQVYENLRATNQRLKELSSLSLSCHEELIGFSIEAMLAAQVEAGKVLARVRFELEIPIDEEWYSDYLETKRARQATSISSALARTKEAIDDEESTGSGEPE